MKEYPILFSGPMVRALLDGSKTQTRRPVKGFALELLAPEMFTPEYVALPENHNCPYGYQGEHLWVRESYADIGARLTYRADLDDGAHCKVVKWIPSIHMFRADSRILLEIVSMRVERLNDCSEADARAEGAKHYEPANHLSHGGWSHDGHYVHETALASYVKLWESINGADSWDVNPWVWVVEFRRVQP